MAPNQQIDEAFQLQQTNENRKNELLYDGNLYDVSTFIRRHPGGHEIIQIFTEAGEDATLAIQQFHSRSIDKVLKMMKTLPNRPEPQIKLSIEMKEKQKRDAELTADFIALYTEIKEEGLFKPSIPHWVYRFVEIIALGLLGHSLITTSSNKFASFFGSFLLAMAMGRGIWIMHETSHFSATGNPKLDRLLNDITMGITLGISGIWWRRHHNLHHAKTNRIEADPDLVLLPGLLLQSQEILKDPAKDQTFFYRYQLYFSPVYTFLTYLRWMTLDSIPFLFRKRKTVEWISIFCYYYIMYQIGFVMWLITANILADYFFLNALLSHTYVPVTAEPTHWVEQCFVNTVNIAPTSFVNWWMGYLNYQIEHHLFPTLPQFRSPLIADRVKALAKKHGFPYYADSYATTVVKALSNLKNVSDFLHSVG